MVYTSGWGVTMRQWKHAASTPEFLDFTIVEPTRGARPRSASSPPATASTGTILRANYRNLARAGGVDLADGLVWL